MNDLRDFFKLLRYLLIFLVVVFGMALYSKAHAVELLSRQLNSVGHTSWGWTYKSYKEPEIVEECKASRPDDKIKEYILSHMKSVLPNAFYSHFEVLWYSYGSGHCKVTVNFFTLILQFRLKNPAKHLKLMSSVKKVSVDK